MSCDCATLKTELLSQRKLMVGWFQLLLTELQDVKRELSKFTAFNNAEQETRAASSLAPNPLPEPVAASAFLEINADNLCVGDAVLNSNLTRLFEPAHNSGITQAAGPNLGLANEMLLEKNESSTFAETQTMSVEFSLAQNDEKHPVFDEPASMSNVDTERSIESIEGHSYHQSMSLQKEIFTRQKIRKKKARIHKCFDCPFTTISPSHLLRHRRTHTGEKPFACDYCDYKARQKSNLLSHLRIHTSQNGNYKFKCDKCEFSADNILTFRAHKRHHSDTDPCELDKPFACNQCDFRTKYITNLHAHQRTHTGEKPFSCDICSFRFRKKVNLLRHKRIHTGEKPYACDYCDYRASQKATLQSHLRTHSGGNKRNTEGKPFVCDQCDFCYKYKRSLIQHRKSHTSQEKHVNNQ